MAVAIASRTAQLVLRTTSIEEQCGSPPALYPSIARSPCVWCAPFAILGAHTRLQPPCPYTGVKRCDERSAAAEDRTADGGRDRQADGYPTFLHWHMACATQDAV